ncbi:SAM-dependent methyltransferase, partial [Escherichia coli]|nr:SAM-dependent methyltransferase [Escherichia coli]
LHIVDFGQYERLPKFAKKLHFKSLNDFHVFPRAELPAVLKRIAEEQGLRLDFRSTLRGYVWSATLTRD